MKNSLFRKAIVTTLLAALTAFAIPMNAAPRNQERNSDDSRYYQQDNSDHRNDDSYRDRDNSYRGQNDDRNQGDQDRRGNDDERDRNNRGRNDDRWRNNNDDGRAYDRPVYNQPAPQPEYRHDRSTGKSVLIVAGSAATGAAIGGIAGGGKGAGIGAIVGGLGGFIFDRATAHHH